MTQRIHCHEEDSRGVVPPRERTGPASARCMALEFHDMQARRRDHDIGRGIGACLALVDERVDRAAIGEADRAALHALVARCRERLSQLFAERSPLASPAALGPASDCLLFSQDTSTEI